MEVFILCGIVFSGIIFALWWENQKNMEIYCLKEAIENQKNAYAVQLQGYEDLKKQKHDMKNILLALMMLVENKDYTALEKGLEQAAGYIDSDICLVNNVSIWLAVLESKRKLAAKKGIILDYAVESGDYSSISDMDLCVILGNLLDNAVEAEEKASIKEICVRIKNAFGIIYIYVENYICCSVLENGGVEISSKESPDAHGYGLKSVRELVEKYGGNIRISEKERHFIVEIMILTAQNE